MNIVKVIVASSLLAAGISLAQAQESSAPNTPVVQAQTSAAPVTHVDNRRDSNDRSEYPSGFNTGPTMSNVKGCVGPVSFCNIYFGS
jgi:hypothetical protein